MKYYDKTRKSTQRHAVKNSVSGIFRWLRDVLRANRPSVSPRLVLLSLLGIILGGALACQIIWQHVRYTREMVQLQNLEEKNHKLRMRVQEKKLVVTRLERLDRIQRIAVKQLGMESLDETPVMRMTQTQWVQSPRKGGKPMTP